MRLKKLNNLILFVILIIFSIQLFGLAFLFVAPVRVEAQVTFTPQITVPGSDEFVNYEDCKREECVSGETEEQCKEKCAIEFDDSNRGLWIAKYIQAWYTFVVAGVGILAVVMIMGGGLIWLTAGGRANQISTAKDWIMGAVIGLILALMGYTLLDILNPNLVTFKSLSISEIGEDVALNIAECYSVSLALCDSYSNCVKMPTNEGDKCGYKEGPNCFFNSSINSCNNDENCIWSDISGYCLEKEVKEGCVGKGSAANGSGCVLNSKCCSGYCATWGSGRCEDPPS
jgi:hypothetical protein